jgi:5-methylcytosine-specific restriction enzyme subunit McrC
MVSVDKAIVMSEWQTCHLDGMALRQEDRRLADSLAGAAYGRLGIDELRTGLRITARSWVGVVRFSEFELRVVPKLAGGDVGLLRLVDFANGLNALDRHPAVHTFESQGASLFDLVALLLAESCEHIARSGLLADYRELEEDLPVVRGRLLVREQVLKRHGRVDRLECRYDEHTTDTAENQLLSAALTVAGPRVAHPAVALRVRRLQGVFAEACTLEGLDLRLLRTTLWYNRLNEHYREAHQLAWLVLDGLGIEDLYAGGAHRTFAFLLDMNRLFEDFISRWLNTLLRNTPYRCRAQRADRTIVWDADFNRPYSRVIPDTVIERKDKLGQFLPLDAKYKLYDDKAVAPADIYQTFLYAYAYGQQHSVLPTAIIIHPSPQTTAAHTRLHVRRSDGTSSAELQVLSLHLPSALDEAVRGLGGQSGDALLGLIDAVLGARSINGTGLT